MSFLAGRIASTEGAYFLQESKQAVTRIVQNHQKLKKPDNNNSNLKTVIADENNNKELVADVLPEVLRHSLPSKIFNSSLENSDTNSFTKASKWALQTDQQRSFVSREAMNPLSAYVSLPQVTFGARRWELPESKNSVLASTANDLRQDKYAPINPDKLKAAAAGLSQVGAAFAIATTLVFGGSVVVFGILASKMDFQNTDDIRTKGKEIVQPRFESYREQLAPIRSWAEELSKKWHFEREEESLKDKTLIRQLSKTLGTKTSA